MSLTQASSGYLLWSGSCILRYRDVKTDLRCKVYQDLGSKGQLTVESENVPIKSLPLLVEDDLFLEVPGLSESLQVMVAQNTFSSDGLANVVLELLRTPCWFSKSHPLHYGRFLVLNFAHYWIGHPKKLNFTLRAEGWISHFIAISEETLVMPNTPNDREFRITHQIEFSRDDESSFTDEEARTFLHKMSLFLSFCRGHWVGYSRMAGFDEYGIVALEQWGTGRSSSWREPSGWLDEHHGHSILQLYEPFLKKLGQESWQDAIGHVVYWFTRADTSTVGPDGACILLQAALERLAWHG